MLFKCVLYKAYVYFFPIGFRLRNHVRIDPDERRQDYKACILDRNIPDSLCARFAYRRRASGC